MRSVDLVKSDQLETVRSLLENWLTCISGLDVA